MEKKLKKSIESGFKNILENLGKLNEDDLVSIRLFYGTSIFKALKTLGVRAYKVRKQFQLSCYRSDGKIFLLASHGTNFGLTFVFEEKLDKDSIPYYTGVPIGFLYFFIDRKNGEVIEKQVEWQG